MVVFAVTVAEAGDDHRGKTQNNVLGHIPYHSNHLRDMVPVCTDPGRYSGMAILDQTNRGGYRIYRGAGFHVCTMQNVRPAVPSVACLQSCYLHPGLSERSKRAKSGAQPIYHGSRS